MKKTEAQIIEFFDDLEIVVGNSEIKLHKHGDIETSWPDNGDIISVEFDKSSSLSSVKIIREKSVRNVSSKGIKHKQRDFFEFDINQAKYSVQQVSDHLLFLCIENLYVQKNIADTNSKPYKLEIISQCNCGHNTRSLKKKIMFFLYEYNGESGTVKNELHGTGGASQGGSGGGWEV